MLRSAAEFIQEQPNAKMLNRTNERNMLPHDPLPITHTMHIDIDLATFMRVQTERHAECRTPPVIHD